MENTNGTLSEKNLAQELIRANRQAEAAESERLKAQSKHYEEELGVLRDQADRNMEAIANLHDKLDHVGDQMTDHTHDTGVRIYRNVQAVIKDEQDKQTKELTVQMEALSDRIDTLERKMEEGVASKDKGPFTLLALLGIVAVLVLNILMFMGYAF